MSNKKYIYTDIDYTVHIQVNIDTMNTKKYKKNIVKQVWFITNGNILWLLLSIKYIACLYIIPMYVLYFYLTHTLYNNIQTIKS